MSSNKETTFAPPYTFKIFESHRDDEPYWFLVAVAKSNGLKFIVGDLDSGNPSKEELDRAIDVARARYPFLLDETPQSSTVKKSLKKVLEKSNDK